MNVLSLFDGISCGQVALHRAGIMVDNYFSSEIDKYCIYQTQINYPHTIQIGDIAKINTNDLPNIDIIMGGSPCTGFSFAGKGLNFNDPQSKLFFEYLRILNEIKLINPDVKFLLENVRMKQEHQEIISNLLGVQSIEINSSLVSAQNRRRLYWTNISNIKQPEDKNILLKNILQELPDCPIGLAVREKSKCTRFDGRSSPFGSKQEWDSPFQRITKKGKLKVGIDKAACLTGGAHSGGNHSDMDIIHAPYFTRRYSVVECCRLQTLPDDYLKNISNSQAYKAIGNGWTVDVIAHILRYL